MIRNLKFEKEKMLKEIQQINPTHKKIIYLHTAIKVNFVQISPSLLCKPMLYTSKK